MNRLGPISFADYLEIALYHAGGGFFAAGGGAGRHGHFLTSPEVGPLFGAVLAQALDTWWVELGRPDPFVVAEGGAGAGTLARHILRATPACAPALRYVLVERSERLREQQPAQLSLEPPANVLGPGGPEGEDEDGGPAPAVGTGPVATSLAGLPAQPFRGVVVANELLDNVPFELLERRGDQWDEVRVGWDGASPAEVLVPARPERAAEAAQLAPDAPDGARIPLQHQARAWLRQALSLVEKGRVVVVDYADTTPAMAARPWLDWVRTYRDHGRGGHPLEDPGHQDVTCEVAVDQLARCRLPDSNRSQADFLAAHGIDRLVDRARTGWEEGAARGDLDALRHKSRLAEAAALTDPSGLGAFRVVEWAVGLSG